jgi:type IV secretion system protein VirB10
MPALPSMMIGSVAMALLLQGPANLKLSPDVNIPSPLVVARGTTIPVSLQTRISTKTVKEGDNIYTTTIVPITVNNQIVIPVGTFINGKITKVVRPGKVKGKAGLALTFQTIIFPTGITLPLSATLSGSDSAETDEEGKLKGESSVGDDVGKVATTTAVPAVVGGAVNGRAKGAAIGGAAGAGVGLATVLLTRGKDLVLDRGTTLEIVLNRPLEP